MFQRDVNLKQRPRATEGRLKHNKCPEVAAARPQLNPEVTAGL